MPYNVIKYLSLKPKINTILYGYKENTLSQKL